VDYYFCLFVYISVHIHIRRIHSKEDMYLHKRLPPWKEGKQKKIDEDLSLSSCAFTTLFRKKKSEMKMTIGNVEAYIETRLKIDFKMKAVFPWKDGIDEEASFCLAQVEKCSTEWPTVDTGGNEIAQLSRYFLMYLFHYHIVTRIQSRRVKWDTPKTNLLNISAESIGISNSTLNQDKSPKYNCRE